MLFINRRKFVISTGLLLASSSAAKSQAMPGMVMNPPEGTPRAVQLAEGQELKPLTKIASEKNIPGLFSVNLVAEPTTIEFLPGRKTEMLAYNGLIPGPLIEVSEGDRVAIEFWNKVPEQESTIHWHGLPVPANQDGNPMDFVHSGAKRTYVFGLPEGSAGSYWYHPHPDKYTAEQVYRGLAGVFIVKPKIDPLPDALGDTILFISDLKIEADGRIAPNTDADWMNGREGDHILVNGQKRPTLTIQPGASRRFRLYNASNGRYLRLAFEGHTMTLIGTDGGLLAAPIPGLPDVLLAPAERAEVVVDFRSTPSRISLVALPYDRGWMGSDKPQPARTNVLTIDLSGATQAHTPLPAKLREIENLGSRDFAQAPCVR